MTLGQEFGGYA